ncbi:MAG: hypothetical protein ABI847_17705, partial [Anaerolineales bacterium]
MQQRSSAWLIITVLLVAVATFIVWPGSGLNFTLGSLTVNRKFEIRQGLDLRGGLQVLLEADLPAGTTVDDRAMQVARQIVDNRVNALGLTEPLVQRQGANRIVVELPGVSDPQQAIDTLKQTGLLEFVDILDAGIPEGTKVQTDCLNPSQVDCGNPEGILPATATISVTATSAASATSPATATSAATGTVEATAAVPSATPTV